MATSLHPIRLLARTDAEVSTVIYCVFHIEFTTNAESFKVLKRLPANRSMVDNIESGLGIFILDAASKCADSEIFSNFVVTTSDGSKFFAYGRSFGGNMLCFVSRFPAQSFSRSMMSLLAFEEPCMICDILLCLCETPVYPAPSLNYNFYLTGGVATLSFSEIEEVVDSDGNYITLQIFHPQMLVDAWEALILERKVLVVSSIPSILSPCCEFLRRLTLPLVSINAFVPNLPLELLQAVEAPFPYLLGADLNVLQENSVDLSESVIIDLDRRTVVQPTNRTAYVDVRPPESMIIEMEKEINDVMLSSLGRQASRSRDNSRNVIPSENFINQQVDDIIQIFIRANLTLFSARSCSVSAFYRLHELPTPINSNNNSEKRVFFTSAVAEASKRKLSSMGFHQRFRVAYGFMQLFHENVDRNDIRHFTPCWVEMDNIVFTVYEFADDLPLFYIYIKDFEAVVPSSMEPEGHVFEVTTRNHAVCCFATTDHDSRRRWVDFIEDSMKECVNGSSRFRESGRQTRAGSLLRDGTSSSSLGQIDATHDSFENQTDDVTPSSNHGVNTKNLGFGHSTLSEEEEDNVSTLFRNFFLKTQMASFLRSQAHFTGYNEIISKTFRNSLPIETPHPETLAKELIMNDGSIISILQRISRTSIEKVLEPFSESNDHSCEHSDGDTPREGSLSPMSSKHTSVTNQEAISDASFTPRNAVISSKIKRKSTHSIHGSFHSTISRLFHFSSKESRMDDCSEPDDDSPIHRAKDLADALVRQMKGQIFDITRGRRQCDKEIRKHIVDDRLKSLTDIYVNMGRYITNAENTIAIPLLDLVKKSNSESTKKHESGIDVSSSRFELSWSQYIRESLSIQKDSNETDDAKVYEYRKSLIKLFQSELDTILSGDSKREHLIPLYQVNLGYLHQCCCSFDDAINCYSKGALIDQRRLIDCLSRKFKQMVQFNCRSVGAYRDHCYPTDIFQFLRFAHSHGSVVGLSAYRVVLELLYHDAVSRLSTFTSSLRIETNVGNPFDQEVQKMQIEESITKRSNYGFSELPDFEWVEREGPPSDILNEAVTCSRIDNSANACDLSIIILTRLREMVREYCTAPVYRDNVKWVGNAGCRCMEIKLVPGLLDGLLYSSAFKSFEIQVSQFQKVNVLNLTPNQRFVFFCNVFNILATHAYVVRGPHGKRLLDQPVFMKSSKYNIGGVVFSLLDIEHGILRDKSSSPMILGPMSAKLKFAENDPKRVYCIEESKPNITFFLFHGGVSSPALSILKDPMNIDADLKAHAKSYLARHVKILAPSNKSRIIVLPQLVSFYWEDFGKKRKKVLKYISKLLPQGEIYDEIKNKLAEADSTSSDIEFTPYDWTAALIL